MPFVEGCSKTMVRAPLSQRCTRRFSAMATWPTLASSQIQSTNMGPAFTRYSRASQSVERQRVKNVIGFIYGLVAYSEMRGLIGCVAQSLSLSLQRVSQ